MWCTCFFCGACALGGWGNGLDASGTRWGFWGSAFDEDVDTEEDGDEERDDQDSEGIFYPSRVFVGNVVGSLGRRCDFCADGDAVPGFELDVSRRVIDCRWGQRIVRVDFAIWDERFDIRLVDGEVEQCLVFGLECECGFFIADGFVTQIVCAIDDVFANDRLGGCDDIALAFEMAFDRFAIEFFVFFGVFEDEEVGGLWGEGLSWDVAWDGKIGGICLLGSAVFAGFASRRVLSSCFDFDKEIFCEQLMNDLQEQIFVDHDVIEDVLDGACSVEAFEEGTNFFRQT